MFIIFGSKNYGKVDHIPGLCYVATQFVHINFVPVWPIKSYVILDGTEQHGAFQGMAIPMSWKSIFLGWLRAGLICAAGLALIVALFAATVNKSLVAAVAVAAVPVFGLVYWLTHRARRPSEQRAVQLGEHLSLAPEVVAKYYVAGDGIPTVDAADSNADG
jgi:hypothetical protein